VRYWHRKKIKIKGEPLVSFLIAAYVDSERICSALACLLYSLKAQTWPHWHALVVHDGPADKATRRFVSGLTEDPRIAMAETPERKGHFGHPWRQWALDHAPGEFITLTNQDNYYAPVFAEACVNEFVNKGADFVYCNFVHSHRDWQHFEASPRKSRLDLGAFMVRSELAKSVPFDDHSFSGDGAYIDKLVARAGKVTKLKHDLFVHN
jgi:hypothetical protein